MGRRLDFATTILCTYSFLIVQILVQSESRECVDGLKSIGYTVPRGDIYVEYGNPLDIYCVIDEDAANGPNASQQLTYLINERELSKDMVRVINSTTINLHIDRPDKQSSEGYHCILKSKRVCMNMVSVGVPPQPVTDFKCVSYNLDNLTCTWTAPENYVKTDYYLSYTVKPSSEPFECPKVEESFDSPKKSCMWSLSTKPIYRQSSLNYNFTLSMSNVFGNLTMPVIQFKHYENVRPNAPENLMEVSKTWNSVNLSWEVPSILQTFRPGLKHRVLYQSLFGDNKEWQCSGNCLFTTRNVNHVSFNLENLEYAHALYDIRVSMISAYADLGDENLWSNNASLTVRTASKKPDSPPRTCIGSFEFFYFSNNSERNVRIYWSHIPLEQWNGENFTYVIWVDDRQVKATVNAHMLIERLSPNRSYTFKIRAKNEMGYSDEESSIFVPAHRDWLRVPINLNKEEVGNGNYRLSWKQPELIGGQTIRNYTIFWCYDEQDRIPCSGKLDWVIVPANATSHSQSIRSNKTYQFAISVNTDRGSSGMTWSVCSYYKYSAVKISDFSISKVGSDFIQVKWSLGCSFKSVTGFIVYFCPAVESLLPNVICKEPERNVTVGVNEKRATIHNLVPYTTYSLHVAAIINYTMYSQPSVSKLSPTLEAAPSRSPTNLKATEVTNSTITLKWTPPAVTNGILKNYYIIYNNRTDKIDPSTSYTLTGLTSYEDYNIQVQACTVSCSNLSETLHVQTLIGYPSSIDSPSINQNETYTSIRWKQPQYPNGRNERFELKITEKHDYENFTSIINTTDREWVIYSCGKEKNYNSFFVSVRAINIDNDKIYYGKWSDEVESYCRPPSNYIIFILIPIIGSFLAIMFYFLKKMYKHFQEMRNVGIKLPQGLQGEVTDADMNLSSWTEKPPNNDDSDSQTAEDEKRLMLKGDSSGCSSAQESVTCSVNSTCNMISSNTSDSGTEHPVTSSAEDLSDIGVTTSLRQRNISKPYVTFPLEPSNSNGTKNYCILGVDQNINNEGSPNYSQLPPSEFSSDSSNSPQYVLTGELVKTANPNYIPFKTTIPDHLTTKNPSYVIAGTKDFISPEKITNVDQLKQDNAYVKIADNLMNLKNPDWQPPLNTTNTKTGYVSIGEIPVKKETKGYVPHRQFESKALKED